MVLGLVPDCDLDKVESAGNAAGTGARIALLNSAARAEIESVVRDIEKIETAIEPKFQDYFVAAMAIPNKSDPFTKLFATVKKPARKTRPGKRRDDAPPPAQAGLVTAMAATNEQLRCDSDAIRIVWSSGSSTTLPHLWLRDNCGCGDCRIAQTDEKKFMVSSVPADLEPASAELIDDQLRIVWPDGHRSSYEGKLAALVREQR